MASLGLMPLRQPFQIPALGIGTYELCGETCAEAVCKALQMGYRLIDTAAGYHNEDMVGKGIAQSGVPRSELFIVVKISVKAMKADEKVRTSILNSLEQLGIGYADCVIIHWPGCGGLKVEDAAGHAAARTRCWRVMQDLQKERKIRFMGVSNFLPRHFAELPLPPSSPQRDDASTAVGSPAPVPFEWSFPFLNQIELHPLCVQSDVVHFCRERAILLQQYAPLAQCKPELTQHPKLLAIQAQHFRGYSVTDVLLMWGLAQGFSTLVRSSDEARLRQNLEAGLAFFSTTAAPLGSRPPLTEVQRDVIVNLRAHLGLEEGTADTHFFWYSSVVA